MKLSVDNLMFESTRRCNLQCPMCLRGDAQDLDMPAEIIHKTLSQVDHVNNLTISGGEPFLNKKFIENLCWFLREGLLRPNNFWLSTNGCFPDPEYCDILGSLLDLCEEPLDCAVQISQDAYHDNQYNDFHILTQLLESEGIRWYTRSIAGYPLLGRGRAIGMPNTIRTDITLDIKDFSFDLDSYELQITDGEIYINALGDVLLDCNLSYDYQKDYSLGNVMERPLLEILAEGMDESDPVTQGMLGLKSDEWVAEQIIKNDSKQACLQKTNFVW